MVQRPFVVKQNLPAVCSSFSSANKSLLHGAAAFRHKTEASCMLREGFVSKQELPARCSRFSRHIESLPDSFFDLSPAPGVTARPYSDEYPIPVLHATF